MASSYVQGDVNGQMHLQPQSDNSNNDVSPKEAAPFSLASPGHGSGRRPKRLVDIGTPTRARKQFELPGTNLTPPKTPDNNLIERKMKEIIKLSGVLIINGTKYQSEMDDLEDKGELGYGTSGHVIRMLHKPSGQFIAVKQMHRSGNTEENKRIAMDLEVVLKSHNCPYIVRCLGCFITDTQVWICMELMATCFDKLLNQTRTPIPEPVIGKVVLATVRALNYLKEVHGVIHRDVKPSNILLDAKGNVKLCDFGISGHLVNSKANTKNAGCTAYLAPERINPPDPRNPEYDVRADVWSLGITVVELAVGSFPYPNCKSDFEVLSRVLQDDPPTLPHNQPFSSPFRQFVKQCLVKDYTERPKYRQLLELPFLCKYAEDDVDVGLWYSKATAPSTHVSRMDSSDENKMSEVSDAVPCSRGVTPGHKRSLSAAANPQDQPPVTHQHTSRFSPLRNLVRSPLMCRKQRGGEGGSPLLLQRFYHQQSRHGRSASLSPNRASKLEGPGGSPAGQQTKRKLTSYLRLHLGGCGGGGPQEPDPPDPPPRHSRHASPSPAPPVSSDSPALPRRYISPVPPEPPPRRLSESGGSPCHLLPLHRRLASLTPQPHRRNFHP